MNFINFLNGYKTYIVAGATILYTAGQYWSGHLDQTQALAAGAAALTAVGLRSGMAFGITQILGALGTVTPSLKSKQPPVAEAVAVVKEQGK